MTWYEMRVDGEKVAAFGNPISPEALNNAFDMVEKTESASSQR